jgi:hypothetical protein
MRSLGVLAVFAPVLMAQAPNPDTILRAMKDEIARTRALRLVDAPPYFVEYSLDDAEFFYATASLGALVQERQTRLRQPRIRVRVGDAKLDNSNHIFSDAYRGSRFDPAEFPLDDNYEALRLAFWLSTDRAYKQALEALARKRASLKNIQDTERLPDFSTAPVASVILPVPRKSVEEAKWRARVKAISAVFNSYPDVFHSEATFGWSMTKSYMVNNEGSEFRIPDNVSTFRVRASSIAADGMLLRDYAEFVASDAVGLPAESDLRKAAIEVAEQVTALRQAAIGESYAGPVLFEGVAGAQLLAEVFGRHLSPGRRPVTDPERPMNFPAGEFEGRLGSRILPEWMDVVDDATQKEWKGLPLLGHYPVDIEGVVPRAIPVVERGVLKNFLSTRQPMPGVESSNGHARLPGALGINVAMPGNLFIRASETQSSGALKKKLLDLGKQRGKPFVYLIRKMDFPSTASLDELRRITGGQTGRPVSLPIRIYRVFPDGREELVRGLRFRSLNSRSLRDITGASDQQFLFQYLESGAPFAHMDASGYVAGISVVAPALLFDELELEKIPGELPKPPAVPPPPLTN